MTSKERVLTAFANREPDRVPINYAANAGIDARLKAHFKLAAKDEKGLRAALGVDFCGANAGYCGPRLHAEIPGRQVGMEWGEHKRWIDHETGGYWDFCDFPLQNATDEEIARWPMPSPDDYNYGAVAARCEANKEYAICVGGPGFGDIINSTGFIFGMEETLVRLVTEEPAMLAFIDRRLEIMLETKRRNIEAAGGGIDFVWMGEDLGTQIGPMIGLDLYRKVLRPRHQRVIDLAKSFNLPVMIHTCGSSSWAYEDFIEMGIGVADTLQPEAANMSPRHLKDNFGGRLAFHGGISTAGPVAFGTVAQTIADCRKTLEIMMPGGGYCFAPTHSLQDNSPTENVVAMYETARKYGRYGK